MTEINNKSILLITKDNIIIDLITSIYSTYIIEQYTQKNDLNKFDLIILDDYKLENEILNQILLNKNILNISKRKYNNIYNCKRPFSLNSLLEIIENFLINNNKILNFKNFKIIENILKYNNKEIYFGNKEINIIRYLYKNAEVVKSILLDDIWGYNDEIETKVLENTINKIRQKFKSVNINDFIIFQNGKYLINKNY